MAFHVVVYIRFFSNVVGENKGDFSNVFVFKDVLSEVVVHNDVLSNK